MSLLNIDWKKLAVDGIIALNQFMLAIIFLLILGAWIPDYFFIAR